MKVSSTSSGSCLPCKVLITIFILIVYKVSKNLVEAGRRLVKKVLPTVGFEPTQTYA